MDAGRERTVEIRPIEFPSETLFDDSAWQTPGIPSWRVLDLIHRQTGQIVFFSRKVGGEKHPWRDRGGVQANRLAQLFSDPNFLRDMDADSYFTPLAYHDSSNGFRKPGGVSPLLVNGRRKGKYLAAFPALFADLDYYRQDLTKGQAIGAVIDAADRGEIPQPSIYFDSGQGLWLFWLLVDSQTGKPPENNRANFATWDRCMRRIGQVMQHAGADPKARLLSQAARIPGSLNSKVNRRVAYMAAFDQDSNVIAYTLPEVASVLRVRNEISDAAWRLSMDGQGLAVLAQSVRGRTVDPKAQERGRLGNQSLWISRLNTLQALLERRMERGQLVPIGSRREVAWIYMTAQVRAGVMTPRECSSWRSLTDLRKYFVGGRIATLLKCLEKGSAANRTDFDIDRDLFDGCDWWRQKWSNVRIAKAFGITEEESVLFNIPTEAQALAEKDAKDRRLKREDKRRIREQAILDALAKHPRAAARTIATILDQAHGIRMDERTVRRYLRNLRTTGELSSRPMVIPCLPTDPTAN